MMEALLAILTIAALTLLAWWLRTRWLDALDDNRRLTRALAGANREKADLRDIADRARAENRKLRVILDAHRDRLNSATWPREGA